VFFAKFPNSPLMPEVKQQWRMARDRLSEASFRVGLTYYRTRWYVGAIDRFREVLRDDPAYGGRDAVNVQAPVTYRDGRKGVVTTGIKVRSVTRGVFS